MTRKCFILYPCGKKFEIRVPIIFLNTEGRSEKVLPGDEQYFYHAQKKFQINNLKVIEEDVIVLLNEEQQNFISLVKKKRAIE